MTPEGFKKCPECFNIGFRQSKGRSRMISRTQGIYFDLLICDRCNHRIEYNQLQFEKVVNRL